MRFRDQRAAFLDVAARCAGSARRVRRGLRRGRPGAAVTLRIGVIGGGNRLTGAVGYLQRGGRAGAGAEAAGSARSRCATFPNGPDLNRALVGRRARPRRLRGHARLVAQGGGACRPGCIAQEAVGLDARSSRRRTAAPPPWRELDGQPVVTQTGSYMHRYLLGALGEAGVNREEIMHMYAAGDQGGAGARRRGRGRPVPGRERPGAAGRRATR